MSKEHLHCLDAGSAGLDPSLFCGGDKHGARFREVKSEKLFRTDALETSYNLLLVMR